jgi:Raf kinase inhibitor-like YbhB/YbcL family protein
MRRERQARKVFKVPGKFGKEMMQLTSPDFPAQQRIPARHTCDDENLSPSLDWRDLPEATAELALTCEDPDAPRGTFVHWVVWGLDPSMTGVPAGAIPAGARQGRNDFGEVGWGGPCPPRGHGTHHYHFTLYALSQRLDLRDRASLGELRAAMRGTILAEATLIGTYER